MQTTSYNVSKLLSLFIVRRLAELPAAQDVVINCVNVRTIISRLTLWPFMTSSVQPGLCVSDFLKGYPSQLVCVLSTSAGSQY